MSTATNTQIISDASARNQVLNIDLIVEITGGMVLIDLERLLSVNTFLLSMPEH